MNSRDRILRDYQIQEKYKTGAYTRIGLAQEYNLGLTTIDRILEGIHKPLKDGVDLRTIHMGVNPSGFDRLIESGRAAWTSTSWGNGPSPSWHIKRAEKYQDKHLVRYKDAEGKERSFYDTDDFTEYTI